LPGLLLPELLLPELLLPELLESLPGPLLPLSEPPRLRLAPRSTPATLTPRSTLPVATFTAVLTPVVTPATFAPTSTFAAAPLVPRFTAELALASTAALLPTLAVAPRSTFAATPFDPVST